MKELRQLFVQALIPKPDIRLVKTEDVFREKRKFFIQSFAREITTNYAFFYTRLLTLI